MEKLGTNQALLAKIMKITLLQCLLTVLFMGNTWANEGKAQDALNKNVSLNIHNMEIENALNQIEKLTQVKFVYSSNMIHAERKVSITIQNQKLSDVLTRLFNPVEINYKNIGNQIILSVQRKVETQLSEVLPLVEIQANPVSGKVASVSGDALAGVSILVKGTKRGTSTDATGNFKLNAEVGETLVFSFVGFKTKEVKVGANSTISVALDEETAQLSEVVIVGARFAKPRTDVDRPVAVDVISAKDIQSSGQMDLGQSINYTAPSFTAVKFGINDSAPFVDPASLRGLGPDQVLVLVNNKRRHKVSFLSINDGVGKGQVGTDVNVVPSLSLKRVEVLRDGAAAQYGSDAIGGVINMELNDASSGG
nr:TonB-dependent receptor plug domain-containing protein [Flectobacillus sp.]